MSTSVRGLLSILFALSGVLCTAHLHASEPGLPKAVLVTGASTGIGRKITELLSEHDYLVYAGARKEPDLAALAAIKNVKPIRLDVTKPEDIAAAVDTVAKSGRGLYGLVNNAGVATQGSVTDTREEEFDLVMNVNVYGPYLVTRAFAPLVIAQKGRIVIIGSIAGVLAYKDMAAYCMSKHAMESFTDSLADEMASLGVRVSIVEPGGYNSEIFKSAAKRAGVVSNAADTTNLKEPDDVAAAASLALFEPNPKRRYLVVPDESEAEATITKQISQLVELNEGQRYTFDRKALMKMLDRALANSRPRAP